MSTSFLQAHSRSKHYSLRRSSYRGLFRISFALFIMRSRKSCSLLMGGTVDALFHGPLKEVVKGASYRVNVQATLQVLVDRSIDSDNFRLKTILHSFSFVDTSFDAEPMAHPPIALEGRLLEVLKNFRRSTSSVI